MRLVLVYWSSSSFFFFFSFFFIFSIYLFYLSSLLLFFVCLLFFFFFFFLFLYTNTSFACIFRQHTHTHAMLKYHAVINMAHSHYANTNANLFLKWPTTWETALPNMYAQRRLNSACPCVQSDQSPRCRSLGNLRSKICAHRRLRSDCANAQAHLSLHWVLVWRYVLELLVNVLWNWHAV